MADGITVAVGMDSSAVNTGLSALNDKLNQTRSQINNVANSTGSLARQQREQAAASSKSGQNMLQLAYAADDAQYGMRGLMNNIPMLAQSLGLGAGLAGVISIAAVALNFLWDQLKKIGPSAKDSANDLSQAAQAIENAQARVSETARERAEWEKRAIKQSQETAEAIKKVEDAYEEQKIKIESSNKLIQERIKLEQELASANKALEIAMVDSSDKNDTQKTVEKSAIEIKYAKLSASAKLEAIDASKNAVLEELKLQETASVNAVNSANAKKQAAKEAEAAEARVIALQKEQDGNKLRAIKIYNEAKSAGGVDVNAEFDPKAKSAAEILKEANRLNLSKFDIAGMSDAAIILSDQTKSFQSLPSWDERSKAIAEETAKQIKLEKDLADAKSMEKAAKAKTESFSGIKSNDAIITRKQELQSQLDILNKQAESIKKIGDLELKTAQNKGKSDLAELAKKQEKEAADEAEKKKKEAEDEAKRIAARAEAIKPQVVGDAISKIGGGGYVGTRNATIDERIARAVEENARATKESKIIQQKILDKKPAYE